MSSENIQGNAEPYEPYESVYFDEAKPWRQRMTKNTFPDLVISTLKQNVTPPVSEADVIDSEVDFADVDAEMPENATETLENDADSSDYVMEIPCGPSSRVKVLSYTQPHINRHDDTVALAVGYFSPGRVLVTHIANRSKDGKTEHMPIFVEKIVQDARSVGATILTIVAGDVGNLVFLNRKFLPAIGEPPAFALELS